MAATVANLTLVASGVGLMRDRNHPKRSIYTRICALLAMLIARCAAHLRFCLLIEDFGTIFGPGFSATLLEPGRCSRPCSPTTKPGANFLLAPFRELRADRFVGNWAKEGV
jgi:hypothetical protein